MFQRILVPLDGSERAERAIPVAARLARISGGAVVLVRAVDAQIAMLPYYDQPADLQRRTMEANQAEATDYLTRIVGRPEFAGITAETVVREGPPSQEILKTADERAVDLIVICSHGRTGFKRWVLGSVAQHIARQSRNPVLVLREQGAAPMPAPLTGDAGLRVLVSLDGSELAETALESAVALAQAPGTGEPGSIHLLFVADPYDAAEHDMKREQAINAAKAYLVGIADRLEETFTGAKVPKVTWSVVTDFDVAAAILQEAGAANGTTMPSYDVIAMATHGRTGVALWAMGSVTERVLQTSLLPLLVVRPSNKSESGAVKVPTLDRDVNTWPGLL